MSIHQILKSTFGYDKFRAPQEEIVNNILEGNDTFVLMPTGGGKSICYQVPALVLPHLTLVISPLISLMQDQVEALKANGVKAEFYNSTQSSGERNEIIQDALGGKLKLLYMAPETMLPAADSWLNNAEISLIAIDEAHCVSSWGHDFRPEYTKLSVLRNHFPNAPVVALTATADKLTRKDIVTQLKLREPEVFISSFDRKNINLTVGGTLKKKEKEKVILNFINKHPHTSGIIYCLSRKETEAWAKLLRSKGIKAGHYHAGMPSDKRAKVQQDFITDDLPIICATIAFGMGIDKSNVRWVIHNNLPKNIESYYQEIGRAGRDGMPSKAVLFYTAKDSILQSRFIKQGENKAVNQKKLQRMLQFAEATSCRRKILLNYFNETLNKDCGNCDVCLNPPAFFDGTIIAQMALSGIYRTQERVSSTALVKLLRGSEAADVVSRGFHKLKTHGVGKGHPESDWHHYVAQLTNLALIEIDYENYLNLKLTKKGNNVLFGKEKVQLTQPPVVKKKEEKVKKESKKKNEKSSSSSSIMTALKELRMNFARDKKVPAYIIFNDATLHEMVQVNPKTLEELSEIQGVGQTKLNDYGQAFLECLTEHNTSSQLSNTYIETLSLLEQGLTTHQIADKRGIKQESVMAHVGSLIEAKLIKDPSPFISIEDYRKVQHAVQSVQHAGKLKPIFDYLDEEVSYSSIRLALCIMRSKG